MKEIVRLSALRRAYIGARIFARISPWIADEGFDSERFHFTRMRKQIERYVEKSGIAWMHLRPSQFMQVYFRDVAMIVAESSIFLPMDEASLAPLDIEDVARIALSVLLNEGQEGKSFEMTGPEVLTMAQIADHASAAIGRGGAPRPSAVASWKLSGWP
jgi:uncharacterized protein YbjT (DUF2867 family)